MRYTVSKTAIIGLPYYFAFLLFLMPHKFNKSNTGPPFQMSWARMVLSTIVFTAAIIFFLFKGHYLVALWHITCIYFFTVIHSRNDIMICLNSMYTLLKITKYQQSILLPILLIFSSFFVYVATDLFVLTMYTLDRTSLTIQLMYLLDYSLETTFNALCFATTLVFRDIRLQIKAMRKGERTKQNVLRLIHTQWLAYQQVDLISQAFSPYLLNYITVSMSFLMYTIIYYKKVTNHVTMYMPLILGSWSLSLMCYCSQLIDSQADKLLLEIQGLIYDNTSSDINRMLILMMEQVRLRRLHISVQGCFKLHLPLLLTLANIFVTYMVVLLGFT